MEGGFQQQIIPPVFTLVLPSRPSPPLRSRRPRTFHLNLAISIASPVLPSLFPIQLSNFQLPIRIAREVRYLPTSAVTLSCRRSNSKKPFNFTVISRYRSMSLSLPPPGQGAQLRGVSFGSFVASSCRCIDEVI